MPQTKRHNIFISYHHEQDQHYKEKFVQMMGNHIVDKSVDIKIDDDQLPIERTLQIIREEHISTASVLVVLIGRCTWKRKYVDWEIGASLTDTDMNPRCGLLCIILPDHPDYDSDKYDPHLIPPRLADNCNGDNAFAHIYDWPKPWHAKNVKEWIHKAFLRRKKPPWPKNKRRLFAKNWRGRCADGWQGQEISPS